MNPIIVGITGVLTLEGSGIIEKQFGQMYRIGQIDMPIDQTVAAPEIAIGRLRKDHLTADKSHEQEKKRRMFHTGFHLCSKKTNILILPWRNI